MEQKTILNSMAVLKKPILIAENNEEPKTIFGVLFNKTIEANHTKEGNHLSEYLDYLGGISNLLKVAEYTENDENEVYKIPKYGITISNPKNVLAKFITVVAKGLVEYYTIDFEQPIEYKDGEVDVEDPHLIINNSLIERYTK